MSNPVILTGLRANNDLHLGNYLGALLPIVEMQKKYAGQYQINLFVPDLHSFTTPIDHTKLQSQIMNNLKVFVAGGLDLHNEDTYIYRQSYVPAHSELTIILNNFAYMGELSRMIQYKDKTRKYTEIEKQVAENFKSIKDSNANIELLREPNLNEKGRPDFVLHTKAGDVFLELKNKASGEPSVGLFDYPVLMTADILLYGAKYVPVGADQTQHVELARDIAIRMNNKFGSLFNLPEAEKQQVAFASKNERLRVRDLLHPEKKMSKSDESGKGVIFLSDKPVDGAKKIMSATTDSAGKIAYDYDKQPGISNLLDILAALTDTPIRTVVDKYSGQSQYGELKRDVADVVEKFLKDFQTNLEKVDESKLLTKLSSSEKEMNKIAEDTIKRVQIAVGLRPKE